MKRNTVIESLINAQEAPTVIIDKHYRIVAANRAYCTSYGVKADTIIGHCCHEISHHSPVPCHQNGEDCPHKAVMANDSPSEVVHTHFDYANRPDRVRIKAYPIETANGDRFVVESIHRLAPAVHLSCEEMRMVGHSPVFLQCIETLTLAARSTVPILIYGETGVGKEMAAEFIHEKSDRRAKSYVEMNCAAIPESLFESELFGHERGAFTGCAGFKPGLFEAADKGTLLLDEIGELPLSMQAKLLRVLDTGEFRRLGGNALNKVDVRLLTSTNKNLMAMVANGTFREDLYFRIAGIKVHIPPLRERRMDIPALVEVLIKRMCDQDKAERCHITNGAIERLMRYGFPGNVRELLHVLQQAMALSRDGVITADHIHFDDHIAFDHAHLSENAVMLTHAGHQAREGAATKTNEPESLVDVEAHHIAKLLQRHHHNLHKTAKALGISERTLYRKIKRHHLDSREVAVV
ncbi:MAG TPA: sigma 54-interacting transcriptional regulator [Candidatus Methylomirabilis sp.]|nr:sigma 54-interacting transcriptional regulator [Candidatus Methylomirabilis sp.]